MDFATLAGIVVGLGLIGWAIFMGGGLGIFINVPSIMITCGGTFCATLVHFPMSEVLSIFSVLKRTFTVDVPQPEKVINDMVEFDRIVRQDGLRVLDDTISEVDDEFLAKGLQHVVDGADADQIHERMLIELNTLRRRHQMGAQILAFMGESAPAFGMLGTLIGLVQMLRNLNDPSAIGNGMAVAILTTFYGSLLANLICIPMAGKLEARSREEMVIREMMIEGLIGVQQAINPRTLQDRMTSYLHPEQRRREEELWQAHAKTE